MPKLTERQRIEILALIGYGDRERTQQEVCTLFDNKYPELNPISQSTVSRIERKFRENGNVRDLPRTGRPAIEEDTALDILVDLQENPHKASRAVAADCNVSQRTVLKTLKRNKWHPYKVTLVQELNEDDPDRRLEFCETMMNMIHANPMLLEHLGFSDEATFYLNGNVNRQNCRYWSSTNPHWFREHKTQYPEKINVWAGIINNTIIGPFFYEGTLTGLRYLEMLRTQIVPALAEIFPNAQNRNIPANTVFFQQDGAPPHYTRQVREYLNEVFPNRWIGRRGAVEWPARSPDLTPLDFFLWGYVKSQVYKDKPNDVEQLMDRIRMVMRSITPEILQNVRNEFLARLGYCQEAQGEQFEHIL